jgi:broad specificity phosphatase PhoE
VSRRARVHLARHAPTAATRRHAFPADEPLDVRGEAASQRLTGWLDVDRVVTSPAARCRATARCLGNERDVVADPRWTELDFGAWAGRTMDAVWEDDRDALNRWLDDPTVAPPGGESLAALAARVGGALADLRADGVTTAVVTSGGPIKVAVLTALAAPWSSLWHLDVAPCSVTTLHARPDGGWTVRGVNVLAGAAVPA